VEYGADRERLLASSRASGILPTTFRIAVLPHRKPAGVVAGPQADLGVRHWHAGTAATQGVHIATYITLLKYTEQGLKTIKESPSRLEKAKQLLKSLGGELKSFHLVQGRYDAIVLSEAPNDEVVIKFALVTGSLGNVRTETLRAFTEDEYRKIVSALP